MEIAPVERGSVADVLIGHAVLESERSADLHPQATGVLVSVHAHEGDVVGRGQLLAVLANVSLDAGAERARAELANLQREVTGLESLHARGAVSDRDLADARHRLATARTSSDEATRTQGQTRITAPFAGVIAARDVRVGELASSAQRAFQVVDLDALRVVAELPERDVGRVREGQPVRVASAYDPALTSVGEVRRISPVIDPASGTFRVTIALAEGQRVLRPGQFVSVGLEVDRHDDVLVIPRKALAWENGAPVAWRMIPEPEPDDLEEAEAVAPVAPGLFARLFGGGEDHDAGDKKRDDTDEERFVADRVALELGLVDGDRAEVVTGLALGDRIITVGQATLRDGALVRTPEMQAEARRRAREAKAAAEADAGGEG